MKNITIRPSELVRAEVCLQLVRSCKPPNEISLRWLFQSVSGKQVPWSPKPKLETFFSFLKKYACHQNHIFMSQLLKKMETLNFISCCVHNFRLGPVYKEILRITLLLWLPYRGRVYKASRVTLAALKTLYKSGLYSRLQETKHDKCVNSHFGLGLLLLENVSTNSFLRSKLKYSITELLIVLLSN